MYILDRYKSNWISNNSLCSISRCIIFFLFEIRRISCPENSIYYIKQTSKTITNLILYFYENTLFLQYSYTV